MSEEKHPLLDDKACSSQLTFETNGEIRNKRSFREPSNFEQPNSILLDDINNSKESLKRSNKFVFLLCLFGFFRSFKPSEPFLHNILVDYKHFSNADINNSVYPYYTYGFLVALFFIGPFTELVSFKRVVVLEAILQLCTRTILIWGTSLEIMRFMQVAYGLAEACNMMFFVYGYKILMKSYYQKVSSYIRGFELFGHLLGSLCGQLLVSFSIVSPYQLLFISFATVTLATLVAPLLPSERIEATSGDIITPDEIKIKLTYFGRFRNLIYVYASFDLLFWGSVWIFVYANVSNVQNYGSSLWHSVSSRNPISGYIDALSRVTCAFSTLLPMFLNKRICQFISHEIFLCLLFCLGSFLCVLQAYPSFLYFQNDNYYNFHSDKADHPMSQFEISIIYSSYVVYCGISYYIISLVSTKIAICIHEDSKSGSYAAIFGLLAFLSAFIQVIGFLYSSCPMCLDFTFLFPMLLPFFSCFFSCHPCF